jgi:hypothetical protein
VQRALGLGDVARELGFLRDETLLELGELLLAPLELVRPHLDIRLESRLAGVDGGLALVDLEHPRAELFFVRGDALLLALDALGDRVSVLFGIFDRRLTLRELALPLLEPRLEQLEIPAGLLLALEPAHRRLAPVELGFTGDELRLAGFELREP